MDLSTPIENLSTVPFAKRPLLKKLGIDTLEDLLLFFPTRYEDRSNIKQIAELKIGETVTVLGFLKDLTLIKTPKKRLTIVKALFVDDTGAIQLIWYGRNFLKKALKKGDRLWIAGKVTESEEGLTIQNAEIERFREGQEPLHMGRIVPIYRETGSLTTNWTRRIIFDTLLEYYPYLEDFLPPFILEEFSLISRPKAFFQIHFPSNLEEPQRAKERFYFEQLFLVSLFVLEQRIKLYKQKAIAINPRWEEVKRFIDNLPFSLTQDQKKAVKNILKDMSRPKPMNRLLQGDVGSGKTVVSQIISFNVAKHGLQTAFMVPTEVLAQQHFKSFVERMKPFGISVGLLTSSNCRVLSQKGVVRKRKKEKLLKEISEKGEPLIVIGTQALIQKEVRFKNLGLVILDEQHRFGVNQRAKLVSSGSKEGTEIAHLLSMTATPIPRTLALSLYGDLDISSLKDLPMGQRETETILLPFSQEQIAFEKAREELKKGNQVFVLCPAIEPSQKEKGPQKNVTEETERLQKEYFKEYRVASLHGKMKPEEKEKTIMAFGQGQIDVLVSTSVIEVGLDIPRATVIIIEEADRFGLAQLHQFRGRIGRRGQKSFCFLLSEFKTPKARERLEVLLYSYDGFEISQKDLELRGPGSVLGTKQWGLPDITMQALLDEDLVRMTRSAVRRVLYQSPELVKFPKLKKKLSDLKLKIHLE